MVALGMQQELVSFVSPTNPKGCQETLGDTVH
jgi:hypothetical protein